MAKNKRQKNKGTLQPSRRIRLGFMMVNPRGTPVPVAKPSDVIQLTPIVQPIAMSPFATQQQPLYGEMGEDDY